MKKILTVLSVIIFVLLMSGCTKKENPLVKEYLESIDVPEYVIGNFNLPREINGEKDHKITWESSDESIVKIGNIITVAGLEYYNIEVNQEETDCNVTLKALLDLKGGSFGEKEFTLLIKADTSVRDNKIKYIKNLIKEYDNISIKQSISFPIVTEEYDLKINWHSNNEQIISSNGEYNAPEVDTKVEFKVTAYDGDNIIYEHTITIVAINKNVVEKEVLLDFVASFNTYAASWGSGYESKILSGADININKDCKIELSRANKQAVGNTIDDRPVIACKSSTEYITVTIKEDTIKAVEFDLKKWTTKTFDDIHIEYFNGNNWVNCSNTIKDPQLIKSTNIPSGVTMVRLVIKCGASKNTQVGLSTIRIEMN